MVDARLLNQSFINARDQLLLSGEGYVPKLYFDIGGIPTMGVGFTLIAKPNAWNGGRYTVDPAAVINLQKGITTTEYNALLSKLESTANALNSNSNPDINSDGRVTINEFRSSPLGKEISKGS